MLGHNRAPDHVMTVERAALICAERGLRFTPLRQCALEVLLDARQPLGAYDLIRRLAQRFRRPVSPPTAYRALDFLQRQGFVRRLETSNAFLASYVEDPGDPGLVLICRSCGTAVEVQAGSLGPMLETHAIANGFTVSRSVLEMEGLCASCTMPGDPA